MSSSPSGRSIAVQLCRDRMREIMQEREPTWSTLVPDIAKSKVVAQIVWELRTARQTCQDRLKALGLVLYDHSQTPRLLKDTRSTKWRVNRDGRVGKVRTIQIQAEIDLLTLTVIERQAYLRKLQVQLSKV